MKEKKTKISVRNITLMAMLIAIEIVLSRFCSIQAWNVKIGFAFIAPVTAAILMGPAQAAVVAGVADVLGTSAKTLIQTARNAPDSLGFPVIKIGKRVRFPKRAFIDFMLGSSKKE